jgi:hypothetical protein
MTNPGAHFEIKVGGVVRSYRDTRKRPRHNAGPAGAF